MNLKDLQSKKLPDSPGVYFFKKGRNILYIGKATSLKDRTRSYFSSDLIKTRGPAIVDMVTQSDDIEYEKTDSVLEALVLESALIKKNKPKYNVKEKDDRSYNVVLITDEDFPKVFVVRSRELKLRIDGDRFKMKNGEWVKIRKEFGPFPSSSQLNEALKIIRKIFPFYDEKRVSKMNRQIGILPREDIGKTEYKRNIRNVELFFEGKKKKVLVNLNTQMKRLAKEMKFEEAEVVKRQIFALEHINDVSLISDDDLVKSDVRIESYDIAHMSGKNTVGVMVVMEDGELNSREYRKFIIREAKGGDDTGALKEVLRRRFNHDEWELPKLIVIDGGKGQRNAALSVLKEYGYEIPVVSVVKDERHKARDILGEKKYIEKYSVDVIKVNDATHRFAIGFHRRRRGKID